MDANDDIRKFEDVTPVNKDGHCWHFQYREGGVRDKYICCNCGGNGVVHERVKTPDIPQGHGEYYPSPRVTEVVFERMPNSKEECEGYIREWRGSDEQK